MSEWKYIPGYEGIYTLSITGEVISVRRSGASGGKIKSQVDKDGYTYFTLHKNNRPKKEKLHRLLMLTFLPIPTCESLDVNHKDGIRSNNDINNLEWMTKAENTKHAVTVLGRHRGSKNPSSKLKESEVQEIKRLLRLNISMSTLGKMFCVTRQVIWAIKHGHIWGHV